MSDGYKLQIIRMLRIGLDWLFRSSVLWFADLFVTFVRFVICNIMANGISLLPSDLRDKEEKEKEKMKQAISRPDFKFHEPEARPKNSSVEIGRPGQNRSGVEIGISNSPEQQLNRGVFQIKEKGAASFPHISRGPRIEMPRMDRAPEAVKPAPMKPKPIETVPVVKSVHQPLVETQKVVHLVEEKIKMHLPEKISNEGLDDKGRKVIRETSDKTREIVRPQSFLDLMKRRVRAISLKKTPAEINLISEDYQKVVVEQFWRRLSLILIALLGLLLVFSIAYVGLKIYKLKLINVYETTAYELQKATSEIAAYETDEAQIEKLAERARILQVMLKNHLYWTKLFDILEHHTAENVLYNSLVAEDSGRVLLAATAKSYADVAKQIFIFENADFVKGIEVSSAGRSTSETSEKSGDKEIKTEKTEVQFNVNLTLKDDALLK